MNSKWCYGLLSLMLAAACGTSRPRLAVDLRPRMSAIRADAAILATLLARGRIEDAVAPAERLARADFGAVGDLPTSLADQLGLYRSRAEVLRQAATRLDLSAARTAFDHLIESCTACHRDARPGHTTIELRIERP